MPAASARREGGLASRTPSGWCSGATRRSTRPATRAASCGSCTTSTKRVQAHYADSTTPNATGRSQPRSGTTPSTAPQREPDAEDVLREINGYDVATGAPRARLRRAARPTARPRAAAGSTPACFADGVNQAAPARRPATSTQPGGWVSPEWGWAWPANRRMLYNRASADPDGQAVVASARSTSGGTRSRAGGRATTSPTSRSTSRPDYRAPEDGGKGMDAISGDDPFIMMADGRGWLYSPSGLLDGPLPTHYEPIESPVAQPAVPDGRRQPGGDPLGAARATRATPTGDPRYPRRRDDVPADRAPHRRRR